MKMVHYIMKKTYGSISLRISSNYSGITKAVNGILDFIRSTGTRLSDETYFDIKVILNELIINAIIHGNNCDYTKSVDITAELTDDGYIRFVVKDEGKGYDISQAMQKCEKLCGEIDLQKLQECGRGMLIVRNLCDRVEFFDSGSRVEVYKKI